MMIKSNYFCVGLNGILSAKTVIGRVALAKWGTPMFSRTITSNPTRQFYCTIITYNYKGYDDNKPQPITTQIHQTIQVMYSIWQKRRCIVPTYILRSCLFFAFRAPFIWDYKSRRLFFIIICIRFANKFLVVTYSTQRY